MSVLSRTTRRVARAAACAGVFLMANGGASVVSKAQNAATIDAIIAEMTLDQKIALLHGAQDPERYGQAGYVPGIPELGIPPLRLTDGPAGIRTGEPATALPAPVALAATFSTRLAGAYGYVLVHDAHSRHQNVLLGPMVNIVRVPQGGRNFETLGEDPFLASRIVANEVTVMAGNGIIVTVKHFAMNNQETQRNSVSADVDERTMREIELPAFEAAVKAGAGAVMAAYNKVNGTWSSENPLLLTDILRREWGFGGFVMSDWGGTHSGVPAITAGLDLEMPSGRNFSTLADAVRAGQIPEATIDQAVRRILAAMTAAKLLPAGEGSRLTIAPTSKDALDIATVGAVLLKNDGHLLPLGGADSIAIIGPTGKSLLVGGGGSAEVTPMHRGSVFEALTSRMTGGALTYAIGYDIEGSVVPASALQLADSTGSDAAATPVGPIDLTGPRALAAGSTRTWSGTITAASTGDYVLKLQTSGGRGTMSLTPPAPPDAAPAAGAGRGGRGGGRGGAAAGLLPTGDGLTNASAPVHLDAGVPHPLRITATAAATTAMQIRLAWLTPSSSDDAIAEAVRVAKSAKTAVVFAYDEGQEGRDRASLSLPGSQDALIAAVAAANPRTVVVLNNGAPVLMPWVDQVPAILQMWYPGQEGAEATALLLRGDATPSGKLPVTFPQRAEDAPTSSPERYPGVDGRGKYSEGIFVGYRWYDNEKIAPLFPFGHGLSYTDFEYSDLHVQPDDAGGYAVFFRVTNKGSRAGTVVPQVYIGRPANPPVPMAERQLVGFERTALNAGASTVFVIHLTPRELSYWSVADHAWTVATGVRAVMVGESSRDIRARTDFDFSAKK